MKRLRLLALLLLTGSRLVSGQAPNSVSLDVQKLSAGATVQNDTGGQNGATGHSYSASKVRTVSAKEALQINVHNFGNVANNARVEWYFIAAPLHPDPTRPADDQEFVFDQGAKDVVLSGGGAQTLTAESKEVTYTQKNTSRGRISKSTGNISTGKKGSSAQESGSALHGWLVRVVVGGKTVATRGSTQTYEDIAQDDQSIQDLLNGAPPKEARSKSKSKSKT